MNAGCCNAKLTELIQRLKARAEAEKNPDVRRGLMIAIYYAKEEAEWRNTAERVNIG